MLPAEHLPNSDGNDFHGVAEIAATAVIDRLGVMAETGVGSLQIEQV